MKTLTRRQINERAFKKERRKLRASKGIWPERDENYLEFVRSLPCLVTLSRTYGVTDSAALVGLAFSKRATRRISEAAHVGDDKGMAQKASDRSTIPLSVFYHRTGPHSHHNLTPGPKFFAHHGLDRDGLIEHLNFYYERDKS